MHVPRCHQCCLARLPLRRPQNGIGAALSSHLLKSRPLIWTQAVVVAANVPLIVLGTRGFSVLKVRRGQLVRAAASPRADES